VRPLLIGEVGVEAFLNRASGQREDRATRGGLDGLEIQVVDLTSYEPLDLSRSLRLERRTEPLFSPPTSAAEVSSCWSANRSHDTQYRSTASRNWRPASI